MNSTFNGSTNKGSRKRSITESLIHDFLSQMNQMVAHEDLRAIGVSLENFHETYDTPEVQAYVMENSEESHEIDECVQKAQKLVCVVVAAHLNTLIICHYLHMYVCMYLCHIYFF